MRRLRLLACLIGVFAACGLAATAYGASRICMSADTLSFGQQPVGSSVSSTVVVANCGDAPFTFTDVSRHPATNAAYRTQTSCSTGMALAPGVQCAATVYFEPTVPGQASGALWFHNTTSTPDQLLTFYGRGVDAQAGTASLVFSPVIANFGTATVGHETPPLVLTLQNAGAAPLVPSALVLNGSDPYDFRGETGTDASACGIGRAIAPGAGCTLILYFDPQASGPRQANLVVDAPQLAALAIITLAGEGSGAPATIPVIEFHNVRDGQYFLTADRNEAALLDAGALGSDWARTGASFAAFATDAADAAALPVCRFFGTPGQGPSAHFFTGDAAECVLVKTNPRWLFEGIAFRAIVPSGGQCRAGTAPVVRFFWPGAAVVDARHRYAKDPAEIARMRSAGWTEEGAVFCAPA